MIFLLTSSLRKRFWLFNWNLANFAKAKVEINWHAYWYHCLRSLKLLNFANSSAAYNVLNFFLQNPLWFMIKLFSLLKHLSSLDLCPQYRCLNQSLSLASLCKLDVVQSGQGDMNLGVLGKEVETHSAFPWSFVWRTWEGRSEIQK